MRSTPGSGTVDVTNNLIQGNAASGGDGGGVALLGFTTSDRVRLYNNVIANNVAGLAGGGISIDGLPTAGGTAVWVDITHNTIVDNDSTGTAGAAFSAGPLTSVPQPAGIAGRGSMTHVRIANSIVWHNRTFYFGPCTPSDPTQKCGIVPVSPTPGSTQYAEIQITARPYWDIANLSGGQFSPIATVLSALTGPSSSANYLAGTNNVNYGANGNSATDMTSRFVSWYFNADRRYAYQVGETTGEATLISVPAALDEGGNFIRPQFGPLSLTTANGASLFGDYHVTTGEGGRNLCGTAPNLFGNNCGFLNANVPGALLFDIDHDPRPTVTPARGADQIAVAAVPAPTVTSIVPSSGARPLTGTANYAVTLTGTNLTGATVTENSASLQCQQRRRGQRHHHHRDDRGWIRCDGRSHDPDRHHLDGDHQRELHGGPAAGFVHRRVRTSNLDRTATQLREPERTRDGHRDGNDRRYGAGRVPNRWRDEQRRCRLRQGCGHVLTDDQEPRRDLHDHDQLHRTGRVWPADRAIVGALHRGRRKPGQPDSERELAEVHEWVG